MNMTSRLKKIGMFSAVVLFCAAILFIVTTSRPQKDRSKVGDGEPKLGMPVSVKTVTPETYPARVTSLGEVTPRYQSTIQARVSGRITFLSEKLQEGMVVQKGEVLVRLEKSAFRVQVAEAESRLETARLNVLTEERESEDARKSWERSGIEGEPASPLVLRAPQLDAARAEFAAAASVLENARVELGHTEIKAPYDGVIMVRTVNPDETVFEGDEVAVIYSLSAVEVGVPLDATEWASLPSSVAATEATLIDPQQKATWDADVVRENLHLDTATRLRTLYLEVKNPLKQSPPLLPGTFVRVELSGKEMAGLLCIPETAFTKEGVVWIVDGQDRLAAHETEPRFYGEGLVYIDNPLPEEKAVRVAVSPNSSYLHGLLVDPVEEGEGE
jgi:RND family efflux transporter MFP subunit